MWPLDDADCGNVSRLRNSVEMLAEGDGEPDGKVPIEASAGKAVIV